MAVLGLALVGCLPQESGHEANPLVVAVGEVPDSAAIVLAPERGFIDPRRIVIQRHMAGRDCLDAVMKGEADLATVSETPIVHALLAGERPRIIATIAQHRGMIDIIADRDQGIHSIDDLVGHKVAYPARTNAGYVAHTFERFTRLEEGSIKAVPLPIEKGVDALVAGEVAALATWSPLTERVEAALGARALRIEGESSYIATWNLVARDAELAGDPRVQTLLQAIGACSSQLLQQPSPETVVQVAAWCETDPESVEAQFKATSFEVRLDQSLLLLMEDQARWLDPTKEHIEILEAFDPRAILAVDPAHCTIIR